VYTKHLTEPPEPLEKYCPEVPPGLARVVNRMLAKKPEDRYQTPREVTAALGPFSQRDPSASPRARRAAPAGDGSREPPAASSAVTISAAYLLLIAFAVMVISIVLMYWITGG
jgi:hypothetical protein